MDTSKKKKTTDVKAIYISTYVLDPAGKHSQALD